MGPATERYVEDLVICSRPDTGAVAPTWAAGTDQMRDPKIGRATRSCVGTLHSFLERDVHLLESLDRLLDNSR